MRRKTLGEGKKLFGTCSKGKSGEIGTKVVPVPLPSVSKVRRFAVRHPLRCVMFLETERGDSS